MKNNRKMIRRNFTLTELMVVIVILVMLASLAVPLVFRHVRNAKIATAKTQIQNLESALEDYKMDVGSYPESLNDLVVKKDAEKWDGPYLKPASIPKDPWGNDYEYIKDGEHNGEGKFDLRSFGGDGAEGGEGEDADITNWTTENASE
jgi:general secretion pathway protein G